MLTHHKNGHGEQGWPKEGRGQLSPILRSYTLGDWGVQLVLRASCLPMVYNILSWARLSGPPELSPPCLHLGSFSSLPTRDLCWSH